jgi:hypothetical protein
MTKKKLEEIQTKTKDITNLPNLELVKNMDSLSEEHERLKNLIINQTYLLDEIEDLYNKNLVEYQKRNK